jgi:mRNA interferase MazF
VVTSVPQQGEIWWGEAEDKRRPLLVVTRSQATPVLGWIVVAPVTRRIRGIPTEVPLGPPDDLPVECVASFDNLQTIRRTFLTERVSPPTPERRARICAALGALADC